MGLIVILTVPKLYVINYGPDIALGGSSVETEIQAFSLQAGTEFSIALHAYPVNSTSILFSVQAPDGTYLVHNASIVTYIYNVNIVPYSYTFTAAQTGPYALILNAPPPALGIDAVANISVSEPLIGQYRPLSCNAEYLPLQQIPSLPAEVCTS